MVRQSRYVSRPYYYPGRPGMQAPVVWALSVACPSQSVVGAVRDPRFGHWRAFLVFGPAIVEHGSFHTFEQALVAVGHIAEGYRRRLRERAFRVRARRIGRTSTADRENDHASLAAVFDMLICGAADLHRQERRVRGTALAGPELVWETIRPGQSLSLLPTLSSAPRRYDWFGTGQAEPGPASWEALEPGAFLRASTGLDYVRGRGPSVLTIENLNPAAWRWLRAVKRNRPEA